MPLKDMVHCDRRYSALAGPLPTQTDSELKQVVVMHSSRYARPIIVRGSCLIMISLFCGLFGPVGGTCHVI